VPRPPWALFEGAYEHTFAASIFLEFPLRKKPQRTEASQHQAWRALFDSVTCTRGETYPAARSDMPSKKGDI
jgi:hypothetical protein